MERSVIFITGAASGIGKATAQFFSAKGWFVAATDINQADLLSLENELSGDCFTAQLDVSNKTQFDEVIARFSSCLLYTSPSPRDRQKSRMPSSA